MSSTASTLKFFNSNTAPEIFRFDHHSDNILSRFVSFLDNNHLCDVVLVAGNQEKRVNAHRLILSSASEYFFDIFFRAMSKVTEVHLQDVSGDALELLVLYCYTGCVELREDTVKSMLVAADIFQLNEVVKYCWNFLENSLHPSNCLGINFLAEQRSNEKLAKRAKTYAYHHFMKVYKNEEFLQLSSKQLTELIASDQLNVESEEDVFRSVMKWIEHDSAAREQHFDVLLGVVRLPLLHSDFITEFVKTKSNAILVASLCRKEQELQKLRNNCRIRSGKFARVLLAVHCHEFKVQCYCPASNKWILWNTPEHAAKYFHVAVMSDNLIIVGGGPATNTVTSLNLKTRALSTFIPLATKRNGHGVVFLHDSLYVIGGRDGNQRLNSVERWDPLSRSWSFIKPMQISRCCAEVTAFNELVFVIGGLGRFPLSSVEFYDPLTKIWKYAASMNVARYSHGVGVIKGHLYAVGGNNIDFSIERYDLHTNTWTIMSTTNTPIFSRGGLFSCTSLDSRLIVSDGENCLQEYDIMTDEWRTLPQHADVCNRIHLVTIPCYLASEN